MIMMLRSLAMEIQLHETATELRFFCSADVALGSLTLRYPHFVFQILNGIISSKKHETFT